MNILCKRSFYEKNIDNIVVSASSSTSSELVASVSTKELRCKFDKLDAECQYRFRVQAKDGYGVSGFSDYFFVQTFATSIDDILVDASYVEASIKLAVRHRRCIFLVCQKSSALQGEGDNDESCEKFPEIAFAGKSNVGKSSLINSLMNRKNLARTSAQPGKTQTINFYNINEEMYLVDLPGYGYAKVSEAEKVKWGQLIERYLHNSKQLKAVFLLIDIRHEPSGNDKIMYDWILRQGYKPIIIATKLDKINRSQVQKQLKLIRETLQVEKGTIMIPYSAQTKQGRDEIYEIIDKVIEDFWNPEIAEDVSEEDAEEIIKKVKKACLLLLCHLMHCFLKVLEKLNLLQQTKRLRPLPYKACLHIQAL